MIWTSWATWMIAALILGIVEVLAPSFFALGFAIGAAIIGAIFWLGLPGSAALIASLPLTLVVFGVLSLIAWIALRRIVGIRHGQVTIIETDVND